MRDLDLQSALRSTLSSPRRSFRVLPVIATVLALASSAFGQAVASQSRATATVTTLTAGIGTVRADASNAATFTVHVSPVSQSSDQRGTVDFLDTDGDGRVRSLGSAFVASDGTATLAVSTMTPGAHSVRAVYSGAEDAASSISAPENITAEAQALPSFTLSATPTTLNLDAGAQGAVTVTITPTNGFNNYVSLSCAGLPLYTTCTFLPSNVDVNGKTSQSTMTINTVAPSGKTSSLRRDTGLAYAFLLPGALGLLGLAFARNRSLRTVAMFCVVASLVGGASSCAQRYRYLNYGPTANPGTPNGESIIRIYGTSVNGAQSNVQCFQITLNVTSTNTGNNGNILTPCS